MKTAVVTGSSRGIGFQLVKELLDQDFFVYGVSRSRTEISHNCFKWLSADLRVERELVKVVSAIGQARVDVLVNNAGVAPAQQGLSVTGHSFRDVFDLNFWAPALLTAKLKEKLSGGLVLNISSLSDRVPDRGLALYCSSKAALTMFFDVVALENKDLKIINVLPDYVDTRMLRDFIGGEKFDWRRAVTVKQAAKFLAELISDSPKVSSGSEIIMVNNLSIRDLEYQARVWVYNTDTGELKKEY